MREVEILQDAIAKIEESSKVASASGKTYELFFKLKDEIEEHGCIDVGLLKRIREEIFSSAKYAGYTNIQYGLMGDVMDILNKLDGL